MEWFTDILGQDIKPGCFVLYAALDSRSAVMRIGKVVALRESSKRIQVRMVRTKHTYNQETHRWSTSTMHNVNPRIVSLAFPGRMVVIPSEMIQPEIVMAFRNIELDAEPVVERIDRALGG